VPDQAEGRGVSSLLVGQGEAMGPPPVDTQRYRVHPYQDTRAPHGHYDPTEYYREIVMAAASGTQVAVAASDWIVLYLNVRQGSVDWQPSRIPRGNPVWHFAARNEPYLLWLPPGKWDYDLTAGAGATLDMTVYAVASRGYSVFVEPGGEPLFLEEETGSWP